MVTWTKRDDVRDAYRAGISGARSYPGNPDSFQRGQQSAKEFRRNRMFNKPKRRAPSNRWDRKLGKWIKDKAGKAGEGIMGPYHAMAKAGKELFVDPIRKASENERLMGELYKDEDSMDRIRKSLMTDKNKEFYEKYMRLADLTSDSDKAREYRKTANTALSNAQISSRLNYALGQLGYDLKKVQVHDLI